jgi:hypothetical protein
MILYNNDILVDGSKQYERKLLGDEVFDRLLAENDFTRYEDTQEYTNRQNEINNAAIISDIEAIEKKALRNLLTLSKGETKIERDFLNKRIAEIEALRAKLT